MVNEHLITEVNEQLGFMKVWCKDGHYITNWNKNKIEEFTSSKIMFCPLSKDLTTYYCITEEENEQYKKDKDEWIKAQEEARKAEFDNRYKK